MKSELVEFARRAVVAGSVVILLIVLVLGAGYAIEVLMLVFAGLLFATLLLAVSEFVNRHTGIGDKFSIAIAVLLVAGIVIGSGFILAPQVAEQSDELRKTLPQSLDKLTAQLKQYDSATWMLEKVPEPRELMPRRENLLAQLTGVFSTALSVVGAIVVVFFVGIYFAAQPRMYTNGLTHLIPIDKHDRAREVMGKIGASLRWWLMGKLVAMVFVGVLVWLMLMMLGLPFALTLAVIAAVLTFIPNFGPIISAIPAVLIALMDSPMTAVWVIVLFVTIQALESYILTPLIQQSALSLPAALTISAQLLLGVFVGGIGLALASPLTVVVLVLVRSLYVRDLLGDPSVE